METIAATFQNGSDPAGPVLLTLARHQLRRGQGIPTLSVLVGAPAEAIARWMDWTAAAGWPAAVETWPLEHSPALSDQGPASSGDAARPPEAREMPSARLYVPAQGLDDPALPARGLLSAVRRLCGRLEAVGAAQSTSVVAIAVETEDAAAFLRDAPEGRAKTFFREGLIMLDPSGSLTGREQMTIHRQEHGDGDPETDGSTAGASDGPRAGGAPSAFFEEFARAHSTLAQQHASARTMASFRAAASGLRELRDSTPPASAAGATGPKAATADRARSAAEQFLFDLLSDLPETAGLFALNVKLDFCFGPAPAEVDLLAAGLRLAVEIDGYYHFRDTDGYRRDRRKDALLQQQDYLVLRFLAEDVVARLEDILREIRAAVAFRRLTRSG